jgi:hypothetical protein
MKKIRIVVLLAFVLFTAVQVFGQILPPDPGGASVPLDGGILLALLAAGSIGASLFTKSKKKDK